MLLALLVVGSLLPVFQITYATSGSMEPTIPTHSLYVVNTVDDDPKEGEILLFRSPEEGRVTHRVIEVTEEGRYMTKGDANEVRDQTRREDALRQERVVGTVPVVFGHPLVIPGSASVLGFARANPIAALLSLWLAFGAGLLFTMDGTGVVTIRRIALPVLAVAFAASVVFLSVGVSYDVGFLATTGPHEGNPELVPANEESTQTLHLQMKSPPLFSDRVVSTAGDLRVAGTESYANGTSVSVRVPASPDDTVTDGALTVHYYPRVLPSRVLSALHGIHPAVASLVTVSLCYLPVYLGYLLLVDPRKRLRPVIRRGDAL